MYIGLLVVLLGLGGWLLARGYGRAHRGSLIAGLAVVIGTSLFFGLLSFWGEMLWFAAVGYQQRFWTLILTRLGTLLGGALLGAVVVYLLVLPVRAHSARVVAVLFGGLLGALWGLAAWQSILFFWHRVAVGLREPILGLDAGFYLFVLPVWNNVYWLLLGVVVVAGVAALRCLVEWEWGSQIRVGIAAYEERSYRPLLVASAALALVLAYGKVLAVFGLLNTDDGLVAGAGWTDANIRLPALWVVAAVTLLAGLAPLLPSVRRWSGRGRWLGGWPIAARALARAWLVIGLSWAVGLAAVPALVQALVVVPNEITFETPYLAHNIRFTRFGFGLDKVEDRQFPASEQFTAEMAAANQNLLDEVRLWDWRALDAVYKQFQEIRLYYEFWDVDVDRYHLGEDYRQVMISAREMAQANLPAQSQTFVNRRFKYTHGYGLTLAPVSDFTPEGLPDLLIKNIPPESTHPDLRVDQAAIYYGELTYEPVVVNSSEAEFDYPQGDRNVYVHYDGQGGVELRNFWRKFLFGWKFDGTRFLLSSYPRADSRVMFHRQIRERCQTLAPFLVFDDDPYIVLAQGRMFWILDAYTSSRDLPYSEPFSARDLAVPRQTVDGWTSKLLGNTFSLHGANYLRNSVKAVVDAYNGTVQFYVFAPEDPLIRVWRRIFPELLQDRAAMPPALAAHVRYPQTLLLVQGLVYAKYHMTDPGVFYNQEDLWVRATEKYYGNVQPVEPYYIMWQLPGSTTPEFVLMLPFTPKNRQVLIGWIAGMCDGENYGRFLAYKFPKEKRVLGPQQVETKIDQDRFLAGQLTLWDQRGSRVIRGNVLAIPIADTLLYVEPIYLQAETAAYPELRLVVVMHGDNLSYANSFAEALAGLFTGTAPPLAADQAGPPRPAISELGLQANTAFEAYLRALGQQQFDQAGRQLQILRDLLRQLATEASQ